MFFYYILLSYNWQLLLAGLIKKVRNLLKINVSRLKVCSQLCDSWTFCFPRDVNSNTVLTHPYVCCLLVQSDCLAIYSTRKSATFEFFGFHVIILAFSGKSALYNLLNCSALRLLQHCWKKYSNWNRNEKKIWKNL